MNDKIAVAKEITVVANYDVIVCGGGPAAIIARNCGGTLP